MNTTFLPPGIYLPHKTFETVCFAKPEEIALVSPALDLAYIIIFVFSLAVVGLRLSIKIWNDDEGHLRAFTRSLPILFLALTYVLARLAPHACLSPLAFGHWIIAGLALLMVTRTLGRQAELEPRRIALLTVIDVIVFGCYAVAVHTRELSSGAFSIAVALNLVTLYLTSLLISESSSRYSDNGACDRLAGIVILKFVFSFILAIGPNGASWLPGVVVVYIIGIAEILSILHGAREFNVNKFLFGD